MYLWFFLSPVPTVLSVESSWAWLTAELAPVAWLAGTRAVGLVAFAVHALAVPLAVRTPQPFSAQAPARELLARASVAGALGVTAASVPARLAQAASVGLVTHRVDVAVAVVSALRSPEARLACALARLLVALALLTGAGLLTVGAPTVGVTRAFARYIVTLPIRMTSAFSFAVWTPKLGRAF